MASPKFAKGDTVRKVSRKSEIGVVTGTPRLRAGSYSYQVKFGATRKFFAERDLEPCCDSKDAKDLFLDGSFGDLESCRNYLTYLRVSGSLSNYVYAFYNSRTKFYPHQFKPLLKFLEIGQGRLLMADEVGLGKTIEAGLLLVELEARKEQDRVLVVCPAKLQHKWRRELMNRFNFDFEIQQSRRMVSTLKELEENPFQRFLGIVSYEVLRGDKILAALERAEISLNTVIADEAHIVRNDLTKSHKACAHLANMAENLLLLSATPINNSSKDLFNLLALLDSIQFSTYEEFERLRQRNQVIVDLERVLQIGAVTAKEEALDLLGRLKLEGAGEGLYDKYLLDKLEGTISGIESDDVATRIKAQRLAAKVNLLNRHVVRSQRREIDEKRPQREAHVVARSMLPMEEDLYQAIYRLAMEYYDEFRLPVINMERILASSIPAFVRHYSDKGSKSMTSCIAEDEDDLLERSSCDSHEEEEESSFRRIPGLQKALVELGVPILEEGVDTKYECLRDAIAGLEKKDPGCKVIIFSYFRRTINYLDERLRADGHETVVLHGGIPSCPDDPANDEREIRQGHFSRPDGPRFMISSEVGAEGLDFQFAHVVINYDLPWNPMRVEQRIGRIDRIGQKADKLLVYSLILERTIDQSIYSKLLQKIGIFKETLGDLESILGNELKDIQDAVFDIHLTPEQKEARIANGVDVIERRNQEISELEKERSKIIGSDHYIRDELDNIRSTRRYISPAEVMRFCHAAFRDHEIGLDVHQVSGNGYTARVTDAARRFFDMNLDRSRESNVFRLKLRSPQIRWTYDYDEAVEDTGLILLNQRHPVVRLLCDRIQGNLDEYPKAFKVSVISGSSNLSPGIYVLGLVQVEYEGHFTIRDLDAYIYSLSSNEIQGDQKANTLLSMVIGEGCEWTAGTPVPDDGLVAAVECIEACAETRKEEKRLEHEADQRGLIAQRRQQINWHADRRRRPRDDAIATLQQRGGQSGLIKANQVQIDNIENARALNLAALPRELSVTAPWEMVGLGLVEVLP